jgi:hypothetical protein
MSHDDETKDAANPTSSPIRRDTGEQRNGAMVLVVMGVLLVAVILLGTFVR